MGFVTSGAWYYVDTVGRNKKAIVQYIKNQLEEAIAADQISLKEYIWTRLRVARIQRHKNRPHKLRPEEIMWLENLSMSL